jgi:hypothetical protein
MVSVAARLGEVLTRPGARGYAIVYIDSGLVLREEDESLGWGIDIRSLIDGDLATLSAHNFEARWRIPDVAAPSVSHRTSTCSTCRFRS